MAIVLFGAWFPIRFWTCSSLLVFSVLLDASLAEGSGQAQRLRRLFQPHPTYIYTYGSYHVYVAIYDSYDATHSGYNCVHSIYDARMKIRDDRFTFASYMIYFIAQGTLRRSRHRKTY